MEQTMIDPVEIRAAIAKYDAWAQDVDDVSLEPAWDFAGQAAEWLVELLAERDSHAAQDH
jgi:hypothetical protein